jgi:hypothetical protein
MPAHKMRLLQHLFLLVVLFLCHPRGHHGGAAAEAVEGETVFARYLAFFEHTAWPNCYMDLAFEFGCTAGGGTLVVDEVKLVSDGSPVTCVPHPSRGPQFVQCTVGRVSNGSTTSTTDFASALYSARFDCHGDSSSGSSSLAAAAASNVKDAACGPGIDQQVYHDCSLSVYDWTTTQTIDSSSCETGTLELSSSRYHVCSAAAHCTGGLVAECTLTSALVSPRVVFDGFSLPAGAVNRGIDDSKAVVVGLIIIVVVLIAIGAGIGLAIYFCCCKKKKRERTNDDGSRSNHVAPMENRPGGGDNSSASVSAAAYSATAISSATAPPPIFFPKPALVDTTRILPPAANVAYSTTATSSATAPPPIFLPKPALVDTTRIIPPTTGADSFLPNSVMSPPPPLFHDVPNGAVVTSPAAGLTYKDQMRSHQLEHVPVATAFPIDP